MLSKPPDILITTPESLFLMPDLGGPRDAGLGADRASSTRFTPSPPPNAVHTWLFRSNGWTSSSTSRPSGSGCRRRCVHRRRWPGSCPGRPHHHRGPACRQDLRPVGAGARSGHGQPRQQQHLARRRGTHRGSDRGAPVLDRVRQLPPAGRAADLAAQRDSRRTVRHRVAVHAQSPGRWRRPGPAHGQRPGQRRTAAAGPGPPRFGQQGTASPGRGRPQERAAARRRSPRPAWSWASTWVPSIW